MTGGASILIVDDNQSKRLALRASLEPLGYPIVEVDSGVAALRRLLTQDFAVILLDVQMPVMNGFETARAIRQRLQSELTPIIFVTAYPMNDLCDSEIYGDGAVDFISLPVSPVVLRAKVSVFLNIYVKAEELAADARHVQESEDQLRLLTDAAPIGIFQTDAEDRYVYTNPRWTEITGVPAVEAVGRPWGSAMSMGATEAFPIRLADTDADQPGPRPRVVLQAVGNAPRVVVLGSTVIADAAGGSAGRVGTLADVTAEAEAETALSDARDEADAATKLKSAFLAHMSHEIRTPMNGVIGMTELLLDTNLDAQQRGYVQTVHDSGEALLRVINNILTFSKIEAGMLELDSAEFSLQSVITEVVDLLVGSAEAKGLELLAVVDDSVPELVRGDPGRVRQVLINLIGNAIKFTQSGEVAVRIAATETEPGHVVVRVDVLDTGEGIAPDKLELIFQPFVQADSSISRRHEGSGLGLAISAQLVALMGGKCGVASRLDKGSAFWFEFPVQVDASPAVEPIAPSSSPPLPNLERASGHLLLAEDNLVNQEVAVAMLTTAGYTVDTVPDGAAAVLAVAGRAYDAVLMDCQMPQLNGYEATAAIRAMEGSASQTPIIAITAGALQGDRERCIGAGMDEYLSKPLSKQLLLATVASAVTADGGTTDRSRDRVRTDRVEVCVDLTVFAELCALADEGDDGLLHGLLQQFTCDTERVLLDLRHALRARDASTVERLAHLLKGSSAQLGGARLAASSGLLETCATNCDLPNRETGLREIESDFRDMCETMTQLIATHGAAKRTG